MRQVSLERYYFVIYDGALILNIFKWRLSHFPIKLFNWRVNPFRTKTPNMVFPRGNQPLLYHQIANINFFYFHYKSVKLDVLCRQNKTFGNPFQSKKLPICT